MFTLDAIEKVHQKVKSGADFPNYIKELKKMGVLMFDTLVTDSTTVYFGDSNFILKSLPKYTALKVKPVLNKEIFLNRLKIHQEGKTDYFTFCTDCANNGIAKWRMNLIINTCTYFDVEGRAVFEELISI